MLEGRMLGFATIDLSERDQTLTVWLTCVRAASRESIDVGHTNAICFDRADESAQRRAWSMAADRYVVLTERTPPGHDVFAGWEMTPCDMGALGKQTIAAQEVIMAAFEDYVATKRGKAADLMEPFLPAVPQATDQAAQDLADPRQATLAVANDVMRTWTAWTAAEQERVKRWKYMPGGREHEKPSLIPAEFAASNAVVPVRAWAN
jgi:hypothetical protein